MPKSILAVLLAVSLAFFGNWSRASDASAPNVVVSIKPIHSLVAGVMQGVAEPQLLVKGGSPHGYVLRPSEARMLANADLVIWVGPALEGFLEKSLATLGHRAQQLELLETLHDQLLPLREGGSWEEHGHEKSGGHQHAQTADTTSSADPAGERNAHLWLSPRLAIKIVAQTASRLSEIDPARQASYQTNAHRLQQRLIALDRQLADKLTPVKTVPYIVFHDAYQYFEAAYGLNVVGSITVDPERQPGARRISEIRRKIKSLDARCVFNEPQFEPRLVATIIEGTGARSGVLDPLGAELPAGPETYFQLLNQLADNLLAGLR